MTLGEFYCAKLDAPVLFEIKRDGVVYARVYDIRGRSIASLLNVRGPDAGPMTRQRHTLACAYSQ